MEISETALAGCFQLQPVVRPDNRGTFVKTFLQSAFRDAGLQSNFPEHFFSQSKKGVVRGLHFQFAPAEQDKVVFCVDGAVLDFAVDIRVGSATYGQHVSFELTSDNWTAAYIPVGFAHGFAALTENATMAYLASAEYAPNTDGGIRWDSAGIAWPFDNPVVSERDALLPPLAEFDSPFSI